MEMTKSGAKSFGDKASKMWVILMIALSVGVVLGKVPNPLDRYFEIAPSMYRTLAAVVVASKSVPLELALKDALDKDGKLTQANMEPIWRIYEGAIPDGFTFPAQGAKAVEVERQALISLVGARPKRSAWTLQ